MARKTFKAVSGQSIHDICLNTYGSLDRLVKICKDSGVDSLNDTPYSGQVYVFDDSLVRDDNVYQEQRLSGERYATNMGNYGSTLFVVRQNPNSNTNPNTNPANPGAPTIPIEMYESNSQTTYTAGEDNITQISLTDLNGNALTGRRVISVVKEIKPLKPSEWYWNKTSSILTLLDGVKMFKDETLFVLYSDIITT